MAGSPTIRLWGLALWGLCLFATVGAQSGSSDHSFSGTAPSAVVGVLSTAADAAVLPPRAADEMRAAAHGWPLRILVLAAVLAGLIGLPAVMRRPSSAVGSDHQLLRARRYAIALRAPPLQFA